MNDLKNVTESSVVVGTGLIRSCVAAITVLALLLTIVIVNSSGYIMHINSATGVCISMEDYDGNIFQCAGASEVKYEVVYVSPNY